MKEILESKHFIINLWGQQIIKPDQTYRLMKYVLQVECDGVVLLHNVVTGQLVVLDKDEKDIYDRLPTHYSPVMDELIKNHFLVISSYNEHQQVVNLRKILLKFHDEQTPDDITGYTIMPTTGCNARCYYCFERGVKPETMSKEVADDVIRFIVSHCGDRKKVFIMWFGGEPTVANERIDQICEGLIKNGINYRAIMMTNGYLFDKEKVKKASLLWHLDRVQICIDGIGEEYNLVKAYIEKGTDPYERVMNNIGLLLDEGVGVILRMNFDIHNYKTFYNLLQEVIKLYGKTRRLRVIAHPLLGEYIDLDGNDYHGSDEWFKRMYAELNIACKEQGLNNKEIDLPYLNIATCAAFNKNAITITPDGRLVKCSEQFDNKQTVGDIYTGITNDQLVSDWKTIADYQSCKECTLFPYCLKLINCSVKENCQKSTFLYYSFEKKAKELFRIYKKKNEKGDSKNDV